MSFVPTRLCQSTGARITLLTEHCIVTRAFLDQRERMLRERIADDVLGGDG